MRIPWKELQPAQEIHDQNYHRDVYNFSLIKQINHLVLHYCKYTSGIKYLYNKQCRCTQDEAQSKETTLLVHKWNRCSILCNDFIGVQM